DIDPIKPVLSEKESIINPGKGLLEQRIGPEIVFYAMQRRADSGCSAAAPDLSFKLSPSAPLFIVAKRSVGHTIWINSTADLSQAVWAGWMEIPGAEHTNYPPSASYYYEYASKIYRLAVLAGGIHGGTDDGVYHATAGPFS